MNDKKNIERLFKESFKDFEAVPPPNAWHNIAAKLETNTTVKRTTPLWIKISGVAAGLIIGYFILTLENVKLLDFKISDENKVTIIKDESKKENQNNSIDESKLKDDANSTADLQKIILKEVSVSQVASDENETEKNIKIEANKTITTSKENQIVNANKNSTTKNERNRVRNITLNNNSINKLEKNSIVNNVKSSNINNQDLRNAEVATVAIARNQAKANNYKTAISNTIVTSVNKNNTITLDEKAAISDKDNVVVSEKNKTIGQEKVANQSKFSNSQIVVGTISSDKKGNAKSWNKSENQKAIGSNTENDLNKYEKATFVDKNSNVLSLNDEESKNQTIKENKIYNNQNSNNNSLNSDKGISNKIVLQDNFDKNKDSNTIAISEIPLDSLTKIAISQNELDKVAKDKEAAEIKELIPEKVNSWKVRPNVAPIFMSATAGSPIDNRFADNAKSYDNNMSVGIGLDYAISKKFTFRTGINKFDMSYNTKDVAFYANLNAFNPNPTDMARGISTLSIAQTASLMTIIDNNSSLAQDNEIGQNKKAGSLNQQIGYIEFPMEISYKFLDKKFGIQMFTGISTLILNENNISLITNDSKTEVGEANNLNPIHFSSNVGVAFKYNFWKSFEVNFEPTFKYQLFTFTTNAGGFKPYFIGLYSGVSFKF